jgi:hypothetical protein
MNEERDLSLVEALDHLLARGVVIAGEAVISIGNVDLLYLGLNIILANVDALTPGAETRRRIEREGSQSEG